MILLAMDRAPSVRRFDAQGFLHLDTSNISKANICPYYGREIPGWQALGLAADRIYRLLRHPDELAAGAATFNNLPLLSEHVATDADSKDWEPYIVGSTGSHAAFDGTYLKNSLVVWKRGAIDGVMSNRKRELSCSYRYTPDMTPGVFDGLQYDGKMCHIIGNHVTLVIEGRAGPDVLVGDMSMWKSRVALMVSGALAGYCRPLLAADAKVDLSDTLKDVNAVSLAADGAPAALAAQVVALVTPHLAADKAITVEDVTAVLSAVPLVAKDDQIADPVTPPAPVVPPVVTPVVPPVIAPAGPTQAAMDAAIAAARTSAVAEAQAIRAAERAVQPFVGEVIGMDSAPAIYKVALDHLKVPLDGVPESAYGALLAALPKPNAAPLVTSDASLATFLDKLVPDRQPLVLS